MRHPILDPRGLTIIELVAAIGIVSILAAILVATGPTVFRTIEKSKCISNLKGIHAALGIYLADNEKWPQVPTAIEINSLEEDAWWRDQLKGSVPDKMWHCPTLVRSAKERNIKRDLRENHYVPSLFDSGRFTPHKWENMPWVLEIGNNHGSGLLYVDASGAVLTYGESRKTAK